MEKVDYSKYREVMIADGLPITFVGDYFNDDILSVFDKLNIKTLEDLFVAYDNGVFNDKRRKYYVAIKSQTELLLAYYTDAPLVATDVLTRKLDFTSLDAINNWFVDNDLTKSFYRCGITTDEYSTLYTYAVKNREQLMGLDGQTTFYEVIERFVNDKGYQTQLMSSVSRGQREAKIIQNIIFKSKMYEKDLQSKTIGVIDRKTIQSLESQMQFLLRARDNLDAQIALVQNQLSNVKNAGGIRR